MIRLEPIDMMLEKMGEFFDARLEGYEEHQIKTIDAAEEFYHYDTPLTVEHEKEALLAAGFSDVKVLKNWGHTYTLRAIR